MQPDFETATNAPLQRRHVDGETFIGYRRPDGEFEVLKRY